MNNLNLKSFYQPLLKIFILGLLLIPLLVFGQKGQKSGIQFFGAVEVFTDSCNITTIATGFDLNCAGGNNGFAAVSAVGGDGEYGYLWSDPNSQMTSIATGLSAGLYFVTVTDTVPGCFAIDTVLISEPDSVEVTTTSTPTSCAGGCDGSISLVATGGVGVLTLDFNGVETPITGITVIDNLCAGTYTLNIIDATNCVKPVIVTVDEPDSIMGLITIDQISCFGLSDGSVTLEIVGGTPPYVYRVGGPGNLFINYTGIVVLDSLAADTFSILVADANGCFQPQQVIIIEPPLLTVSVGPFPDVCNGSADFQLTGGTPSGGIYSGSGVVNGSFDPASVVPGTYDIIYEFADSNGCGGSDTASITVLPDPMIDITPDSAQICGGDSIQFEGNPTGGSGMYTHMWNATGGTFDDPTSATPTYTMGMPGTYTIIYSVTDSAGCVATDVTMVIVNENPMVTLSPVTTCAFDPVMIMGKNIVGGSGMYTHAWTVSAGTLDDPTSATPVYTMGMPGTYEVSVVVTDQNGCSDSDTTTVTVYENPQAIIDPVMGNFCPFSPVQLSGSGLGGDGTYTYLWSAINGSFDDAMSTTPIYTMGMPGSYEIILTISDGNGCIGRDTTEITIASCVNVGDFTWLDINMNGLADPTEDPIPGVIVMLYDDMGNLVATDTTDSNGLYLFENVAPGNYYVTFSTPPGLQETVFNPNGSQITGTNGPGSTDIFTVANVDILTIDAGFFGTGVVGDFVWFDNNGDGIQDPTEPGIPGVIVKLLDDMGNVIAMDTTDANGLYLFDNLLPGNYTTMVMDGVGTPLEGFTQTGGTNPSSVAMLDPNVSMIDLTLDFGYNCNAPVLTVVGTDPLCNGDSTGSIDLTVSGIGPFTILWSTGETTEDIAALSAGNYSVTVTGFGACAASESITINEPDAIVLSASTADVLCNGDSTGSIDLTVMGGTMPYSFSWSNGATTEDLNDLPAGSYTGTVTDANGCVSSATVTITEPDAIVLSATSVDVLCNGDSTGSIDLTVMGGTMPYSFSWSNGATTEDLNDLPAGSYTGTVTDANGCVSSATVTITEPDAIVLSATSVDVLCNGDSTGSIDLTVMGGTMPYSFSWSNGATTEDLNDLPAGSYTGVVTDANGCTASATVVISEPDAIMLSATTVDVLCNGDSTGSIDLTVAGGITPYSFSWSNGATSEDLNNIPAGSYTGTVTDANGCVASATLTINEPPAITLSATTVDVLCNADSTGSIDLTVSGGTPPYSFNWSNGATTEDLNNLPAGSYTGTVTDANVCTASATVTINETNAIMLSATTLDVLCNGDSTGSIDLTVAGGTPPYSYSWSNGATTEDLNNIPAGSYTGMVTDVNGCTASATVMISEPDAIMLAATTVDVLCAGDSTGSVDLTVSGGTAPYTFSWSNGATTEDLSNVPAGIYTGMVTDANGCTASATVTIFEPSPLQLFTFTTDVTCNGANDGTASAIGEGGTPPYAFLWSNGSTMANLANLSGGIYTVTMTDANGCTISGAATVNEPAAISVAVTTMNSSCTGGCIGTATATASGGNAPYTYMWNDPMNQTTQTATGLCAGTYMVTATDADGCFNVATVDIVNTPDLDITMCPDQNIPIFGIPGTVCECDGKIVQMSVVYDGPAGATVSVGPNSSGSNPTVFTNVQPGDTLTAHLGDIGNDWYWAVNGTVDANIHASCSDDILNNINSTKSDFGSLGNYPNPEQNNNDGTFLVVGHVDDKMNVCGTTDDIPVQAVCACEGKIIQMSVVYDGPTGATVSVGPNSSGSNPTVFTNVQPGDTLTASLGDIGNDWYWAVNGTVDANIHASCSDDILLNINSSKSDFGSLGNYPNPEQNNNDGTFLVVGHVDDEMNVCGTTDNIPVQAVCACDGKIIEMTVIYDGPAGAFVTVGPNPSGNNPTSWMNVQPGDTLTASLGDIGNDWYWAVNGTVDANIHASCSDDILNNINASKSDFGSLGSYPNPEQNNNDGTFLVIGHVDDNANVCGVGTVPPSIQPCECSGGVTQLNVIYDGPSGATVSVGPNSSGSNPTIFSNVNPGDTLVANLGSVGSNWYWSVNGVVDAEMHTSCSDDLLFNINSGSSDFGSLGSYPNPDQNNNDGTFLVIGQRDKDNNICGYFDLNSICPEVTVSFEVMGGTPPFTFQWSNGSTDSILMDNICETTTYTVTVTDANGCFVVGTHTATVIDISCDDNKVTMCHDPGTSGAHTHCIAIKDIQKKLDEGYALGDCFTDFSSTGCGPTPPVPPVPCDCDGKIIQMTTIYDGPAGATVSVGPNSSGNNPTVFMNVQPGDTLTASLGDIGNDWYWAVNGVVDGNIHASCSDDVLGNVNSTKSDFGSLGNYPNPAQGNNNGTFLLAGFADNSGNLCGVGTLPPAPCDCDGKIVQMSVIYDGPNGADITVGPNSSGSNPTVFMNVQVGDTLTASLGDIGNDWYWAVNGVVDGNIHASCSDDVLSNVNSTKSDFGNLGNYPNPAQGNNNGTFLLAGFADNSGNLCGVGTLPPAPCDCDGKIVEMIVVYDGPNGANIAVGPNSSGSNPTNFTNVQVGDTLVANLGNIGNDWYWAVNGAVDANLHASCSDDILGNVNSSKSDFGSLGNYPNPDQNSNDGTFLVIGHTDENGNKCIIGQSLPKQAVAPSIVGESLLTSGVLLDAFPNPFSYSTTIKFALHESSDVTLKVYDISGKELVTLFDGVVDQDHVYQLNFDGSNLADGMYYYRLIASGGKVHTKKLVLSK